MNQSIIDTISGAGKVALTTTTLFAILTVGNAQVNAEYFENPGNNLHRHTYSQSAYEANPLVAEDVNVFNGFSTRLTSYFVPSTTGSYRFRLTSIGATTNSILYSFSGSPIAYATNTTNSPISNAFTINANQQFGLITFVNASGDQAGVKVEYSLNGGAFLPIPTENLREMFNPEPPANAGILATAPGTLGLFWEKQAGHDTYQIFSSASPITDIVNPVNNVNSPFNERPVATYSGGDTLAWRLTGLTNGTDRYTRIRPVRIFPFGLAFGEPTPNLIGEPEADPIPWESTSPAAITGAVRSSLQDLFGLPYWFSTSTISGVLPDGRIVSESSPFIQNRQWSRLESNVWVNSEGTEMPFTGATNSSLRGGPLPHDRTGPFRRLEVAKGFRGASGTFTLPTQVSLFPPGAYTRDTVYFYFGSKFSKTVGSKEYFGSDFEAGVGYHTRKLTGFPRQWFIYLVQKGQPYITEYIQGPPPQTIELTLLTRSKDSSGKKCSRILSVCLGG
jgi:hypothetical protein